ncbi:MAG: outer membrane beta-barrel protein [Bacteroidota bacterium]
MLAGSIPQLKEQAYSAVGNVEIKLNPDADENNQSKIITGFYVEQKDRTFDARWVSYKWLNSGAVDNNLLTQPFDQIFTPQNLGSKFILEEGTNVGPDLYDRYDGHNRLLAGYAGIVTPLLISSDCRQDFVWKTTCKRLMCTMIVEQKNVTDNSVIVPMPFLNLSYNMTEKMMLRSCLCKTVNRPVFRELAPFNFNDFDRNADIFGNKDLKTAKIDNVDLSWEMYPSKQEKISLGCFLQKFPGSD